MKSYALIFLLIIMAGCQRHDNIIGLNQKIHHDDFEYSVSDYRVTDFLTDGIDTIRASGMFYMVKFKVENRAMRVGHKWDNAITYLVDEKKNIYENSQDLQRFWAKSHPFNLNESYNTKAGTTDSTILIFDLPATSMEPYLKVRGAILKGDIFNGGRFRRMKVKLF